MSTDDISADVVALKDLLESDGWRMFLTMIDQEWGADATLGKIEKVLQQIPPGQQLAVDDATQQVLAAQRAVRAIKELPRTKLGQLTMQPKSRNPWRRAGA